MRTAELPAAKVRRLVTAAVTANGGVTDALVDVGTATLTVTSSEGQATVSRN